MSKKWIDRVVTSLIGAVFTLIVTMIILSFTQNYDEEMTWKEKVQELDKNKAEKIELDKKVDIEVFRQHEKYEQKLLDDIRADQAVIRQDIKLILQKLD